MCALVLNITHIYVSTTHKTTTKQEKHMLEIIIGETPRKREHRCKMHMLYENMYETCPSDGDKQRNIRDNHSCIKWIFYLKNGLAFLLSYNV